MSYSFSHHFVVSPSDHDPVPVQPCRGVGGLSEVPQLGDDLVLEELVHREVAAVDAVEGTGPLEADHVAVVEVLRKE